MNPTETLTRGGPPGCSPGGPPGATAAGDVETFPVGDRELLDHAVVSLVAQNRAHAARLEAVSRFHANRVAEAESRSGAGAGQPGFFWLTPLQATTAEFAPLLGMGELLLQADLDLVDGLKRWFPGLWSRCRTGRLDIGRARLAHAQLANLTNDTDRAAYAELVEDYLTRVDDPHSPLCPIRWASLAQAVRRRCLKFPQRDEAAGFAEAYRKRRVTLRTDQNGIACLAATTTLPDATAADYRLTLIAKKLREQPGETRTLAQLRADTLIDLVCGRLTVTAGTADLEDDTTTTGADPASTFTRTDTTGAYARPVINVTVPITTLMGLEDTPGVMAGETTIPADLVRRLALHPETTWYRLLTDPAGRFRELSTTGYTPTGPIVRWVIARDRSCIWPGCPRPASVCELDHRIPYPLGPTNTHNLQPLCRHHHTVKHSEGFTVTPHTDGSYTWTSRFGSTFHTPAPAPTPAPDANTNDPGTTTGHEPNTRLEQLQPA